MNTFKNTSFIGASPTKIWDALTNPAVIPFWMGEPDMNLEVTTTWCVGESITITGTHYGPFVNTGNVLAFDPGRRLSYTHLSSVSNLPDIPENHSTLCFDLAPLREGTGLTLTVENFPTYEIFRHMEFYWATTLELLREFVESQA